MFLTLNVIFTYASRAGVRELLERRWRAGIGLKRILVAGAGDLGTSGRRSILQHRELGYQIVGFIDDRAAATTSLPRPAAARHAQRSADIAQRETRGPSLRRAADEEHAKLLALVEVTSRECIDVKLVPDLLRSSRCAAPGGSRRAAIINVNDVPCRG